jgi:hypothetical protein
MTFWNDSTPEDKLSFAQNSDFDLLSQIEPSMSSKKISGPRWGPNYAIQLKKEFEKVHLQDPPANERQAHPLIKTSAFRNKLYQTMFEAQGFKKDLFRKNYQKTISSFQEELKMSGARVRNIFDDKMDIEGEEDEEDEEDEENEKVKANTSMVKKGGKDMQGIEKKMSLLGMPSGAMTNDNVAIPNARVINQHGSEARILVGVPLLMDPEKVKFTLGSDLKSIRVDYPITKDWWNGKSLYKNYDSVDKLSWLSAMAEQHDTTERKSSFCMTIATPFRIGKYEQEILVLQRNKKLKLKIKKEKKKLEDEMRLMDGWSTNEETRHMHRDWKIKTRELTEVNTHLEEINARKHYMVDLHIVKLGSNV